MAPNPLHPDADTSARKKIYLIRHGQSEGNLPHASRTGEASLLTELGKKQAEFIADRCTRLPIETLISSPLTRARHTADAIAKRIGKDVEECDLFVERRRPSIQTGRPKDDPDSLAVDREVYANFGKPEWRHSDEENFNDLKSRALAALQYLADRPEQHIAVTTHGFFLRILVATALFGESLTGGECERFLRGLHMENTGLTVLCFDGWEQDSPWWLWTWNDHAHLG